MTILDPVPERPTSQLTRRDVARSLLAVPPDEAVHVLPGLQRDLDAAGNAFSPLFWSAAEETLAALRGGTATVGEVRRWLQATGSEPIDLFPAQGFVWPDEDERGPVATEMYALLVSHLEALVADATIDPDRLLENVPEEWAAYEKAQLAWLYSELPDGREPVWAVIDENDEEFLAECEADDAEARAALTSMLADLPPRPRPDAELGAACRRVRSGLHRGEWPFDLVRAAGGVDPATLPGDDADLWLTLAAGAANCRDEPPPALDVDAAAAWMTLAQAEWLAAVVALVRGGPGTAADPHALAVAVEASVADEDHDEDDAVLAAAFGPVVLIWSALGAIDAEERLTPLGWWGLPEALTRAWSPRRT